MTEEVRQEWLDKITIISQLIEVSLEIDFPRDQKDAKFLACAITAEADFLITGDQDFNEVENLGNTMIVSVTVFYNLFHLDEKT